MSDSDIVEVIQAYIVRIDSERQQGKGSLRQADFVSIAEELGLDASARAELEKRAAEHMLRGEGFLSQELTEEAIRSFELSRELQPWSLEPVKALARAHAKRWELEGEGDSREAGTRYCQQWLEREPADPGPYALLKSLKDRTDLKRWLRLVSLFVGVGVLASIAGVFTVRFLDDIDRGITESKEANLLEAVQSRRLQEEQEAELSLMAEAQTVAALAAELEFDLALPEGRDDLEGLSLEMLRSKTYVSDYESLPKQTISLTGQLHNGTASVIREMFVEFRVLDEEDVVLWKQRESYLFRQSLEYRPGDSMPFHAYLSQALLEGETLDPRRVQVIPYQVELATAAAQYDPSPVREITWLNSPPSHIELGLRERSYKVTKTFSESFYHTGIYELENTGEHDFEMVKLELSWTNENGELVSSTASYALSSSAPALRVGETRLILTIGEVPGRDLRPTIQVIEYK